MKRLFDMACLILLALLTASCAGRPVVVGAVSEAVSGDRVAVGAPMMVRGADSAWTHGRAISWRAGATRVETEHGDTLDVTCAHEVAVREAIPTRHQWRGLLLGSLAAGALIELDCGRERYCGEQNPLPAIGMAIGFLLERRAHHGRFVRTLVRGCPPRR